MKNPPQALSILIGESEALTCFYEIEHRIQPDDPIELKRDIQRVMIEKYISRAELTLPLLCEKAEQYPEIFEYLNLLTEVEDFTNRIINRLVTRITELSREENTSERPNGCSQGI